jgi:nickel-dependent lactate racemase
MVRQAVAQYGAAAVESWAKARGVPEKDIEKARRCFNDGFVASLPKR